MLLSSGFELTDNHSKCAGLSPKFIMSFLVIRLSLGSILSFSVFHHYFYVMERLSRMGFIHIKVTKSEGMFLFSCHHWTNEPKIPRGGAFKFNSMSISSVMRRKQKHTFRFSHL